jgi:hypothetical protein
MLTSAEGGTCQSCDRYLPLEVLRNSSPACQASFRSFSADVSLSSNVSPSIKSHKVCAGDDWLSRINLPHLENLANSQQTSPLQY